MQCRVRQIHRRRWTLLAGESANTHRVYLSGSCFGCVHISCVVFSVFSRGEREEEQPGPSRVPPPRQGYCSCCQILYNNVEQHILSPRHREVVHSTRTYVPSGSLMERFLSDVIQHHPHLYNDPR